LLRTEIFTGVGLALGLMLKNFLCHGTKTFLLAVPQNKETFRRRQNFFLQRIQIFTVCFSCP
jgi:hypothetical protein